MMCFRSDLSAKEWDTLLASMGGHPLQSALWGDAKKAIYGISDQRLAVYHENKLISLIRVEKKGLKSLLSLGWVPQGPTLAPDIQWENIQNDFLNQMKNAGHSLCVSVPWQVASDYPVKATRQTIWIDLRVGTEQLWSALDKQWRYGVRSAQRFNVQTCFATTPKELADFYRLCMDVSHEKQFNFQHSQLFLQNILDNSDESAVEAKLFLAKFDNEIAAGAFILRSGKYCHYMWGAVNRKYNKVRAGEFVQWSVIEWACKQNCVLYDLGGIDEIKNPGVASFKKKMGGAIINLKREKFHPFNFKGNLLSYFVKKKLE